MIMVIGSDVVEGMKPEDFLGITKLPSREPSLQDLAVLVEKAGAGLDNALTVGKRWSSSLAPTLGAGRLQSKAGRDVSVHPGGLGLGADRGV